MSRQTHKLLCSLGDFKSQAQRLNKRRGIRTTVTPSLSSDSPNTMMKRTSLTWTCSNTAMTATGSTAAIRLPKRRYCSRPMSRSPAAHRAGQSLKMAFIWQSPVRSWRTFKTSGLLTTQQSNNRYKNPFWMHHFGPQHNFPTSTEWIP